MKRRTLMAVGGAAALAHLSPRVALASEANPMDPFGFWQGILGSQSPADKTGEGPAEIVVATVEQPSVVPAEGPGVDDIPDLFGAWVSSLLAQAKLRQDAKFVGKFFDDEVDKVPARRGTIIAASEAFRDEEGAWDRFDVVISTNFWGNEELRRRARVTSIHFKSYRYRRRADAQRPSASLQFRRLSESDEEMVRLAQIASTIRDAARKAHGRYLGEIVVSPTEI